jgi:hypothetical protein
VQLQPKKIFLPQPIGRKGLLRNDSRKTKKNFVLRVTNPRENQAYR